MTEKNNFIKWGLVFVLLLIACLMWVVFKSSLALLVGIYALIFVLRFIYEYNDQFKKLDFFFILVLDFVVILQSAFFWNYNHTFSFICGLLGFLFLIGFIYIYKLK